MKGVGIVSGDAVSCIFHLRELHWRVCGQHFLCGIWRQDIAVLVNQNKKFERESIGPSRRDTRVSQWLATPLIIRAKRGLNSNVNWFQKVETLMVLMKARKPSLRIKMGAWKETAGTFPRISNIGHESLLISSHIFSPDSLAISDSKRCSNIFAGTRHPHFPDGFYHKDYSLIHN